VYVPDGSVLFARLLVDKRFLGMAIFAIDIADASGETSSVAVQLCKDLGCQNDLRPEFFRDFTHTLPFSGTALLAPS